MKVQDLRTALEGVPDDTVVVVSRDAEGNGFSPLHDAEVGMKYDKANGEIGFGELTPSQMEDGFTDEDLMDDGQDAVVLWPV